MATEMRMKASTIVTYQAMGDDIQVCWYPFEHGVPFVVWHLREYLDFNFLNYNHNLFTVTFKLA